MNRIIIVFLMLISCCSVSAQTQTDAIYQYGISFNYKTPQGQARNASTYLWVPAKSNKIVAVVIASQNLLEQRVVEDKKFRQMCAKNNVAIVWGTPSFYVHTDKSEYNALLTEQILDTMALVSGYSEITKVPLIVIGHSTTNNYVRLMMEYRPEKILAAITMKGGPGFKNNKTIPVLCTAGEFMEWGQQKQELITPASFDVNYRNVVSERKANQAVPITYIYEPGTGHFDSSCSLTDMVTQYVNDIIPLRLNKNGELRQVDITAGYQIDFDNFDKDAKAPFKAQKEDYSTPWFPSKSLAVASARMSNNDRNRATQIEVFADSQGKPLPFDDAGIIMYLPVETQDDGVTFKINHTALEKIPDTFKNSGTKIGSGSGKCSIETMCGVVEHIAGDTYRLAINRTFPRVPTYVILRKEGDKEYRTSVQPARVQLNYGNKGATQTIDFNPVARVDRKVGRVKLNAVATSGMPVGYYVDSGPAKIEGDYLVLEQMPLRARYPVAVKVVAWQMGHSPDIQSAKPITKTILID